MVFQKVANVKISWHKTAFDLIDVIAQRSDDIHTQVGCVILDKNHRVVSMGYNGLPRSIKNKPERLTRENGQKYKWMVHAEQNAILFADRSRLKGSTLYVSFMPCSRCAQDIMQSGIERVIVDESKNQEYLKNGNGFNGQFEQVLEMFEEANIFVYFYEREFDLAKRWLGI